ncbi:MAG: hypothetical protein C0592_03140 [Marinilabiliales bacterium]|nr:MAG: hypothetical protein C0592_03140 [Marinilabiliales bacterium]
MISNLLFVLFSILISGSIIAQTNSGSENIKQINQNGLVISSKVPADVNQDGEHMSFEVFSPSANLKQQVLATNTKGITNYDPGVMPEGEYIQDIAYSRDGSKVFVVNRQSDNVTVFDATTLNIITNITTGAGGVAIDLHDTIAVVACLFDSVATIINLNTYATTNVATSDRPTYVKINPAGTHAYVANESEICEIIDLSTNTVVDTIGNFPVYSTTLSWSTGSGRNYVQYNRFLFTKNGTYLVVADYPNDELDIYNTSTNTLQTSLAVTGCRNIGVSADSSMIYTTSDADSAYRVDASTLSFIGSPVEIPDGARSGTRIVSNVDGTKIYLGTNGNHGTLIDFVDQQAVTYPSIYSAFWCDATHDHQYAVHGNYNFAIINFTTETIEDVFPGYSVSLGAASPSNYESVSLDPLRFEGAYQYTYTTVSNIGFSELLVPADKYEGDAPLRVEVAPDGSKAIMANTLSQSVTVFNLTSNTIDTIFLFPANADVRNVAITHDSHYGLVSFDDLGVTKIIDLTTLSIVADVPGSGHTIRISDNDQYAYISNVAGTDKINVIQLNGASSSFVTGVNTGQMGSTYAHYGILSDIRISPDGNYLAIAVSFDDQVKIMDLSTNTIVQTLSTGFDFPLQLCFNDSGNRLAVTNYYGNTVSIINFNGSSSSVQGTYACGGQYPTRMAFNSATNEFYVCNNNSDNVVQIDAVSGAINGSITLAGSPVNVAFDSYGSHVILYSGTPHKIINGVGEEFEIPYSPANFDINPTNITAVVSPGLDNLAIIDWVITSIGAEENSNISVYPNPTSDKVVITLEDIQASDKVQVQVFDITGKLIYQGSEVYNNGVTIDLSVFEDSEYLISISDKENKCSTKVIKN